MRCKGGAPIDLPKAPTDYLSLGGNKSYGPKESGASCLRRGVPLPRLIYNGCPKGNDRGGEQSMPQVMGPVDFSAGDALALAALA